MQTVLEIQELSISYHKSENLLRANDLVIEKGEIVVLFGDNGSGKSSLLKAICNTSNNWTANIQLNENSLKHWKNKELVKQIAFISTESDYPSLLSTKEYVSFGRYPYLNWFGELNREDESIVERYLKECCIEELKNQSIDSLSDGEKQRAKIARGLCQQTPLLILDEPSSHLDIKNTYAVLELLKLERDKEDKTILFSSHEIHKSLNIADKVWYIEEGRVHSTSTKAFVGQKELHSRLFGKDFKV